MSSTPPPAPGQGLRFRASFTLPADVAKRLARVSKRLGVSQSAFLGELLDEPLKAMESVLDEIPVVGVQAEHLVRASGRSVALVERAVADALAIVKDAQVASPQLDALVKLQADR